MPKPLKGVRPSGGTEAARAKPPAGAPKPAGRKVIEIEDIRSPTCQAILQETRLRMLAVLSSPDARARRGYSLQELGEILRCSPQNAHHHLKILADVGVVRVARAEATQRIPRQFWVADVDVVRIACVPEVPGARLDLELGRVHPAAMKLHRDLRARAREERLPALERLADSGIGAQLARLSPREARAFVAACHEAVEETWREPEGELEGGPEPDGEPGRAARGAPHTAPTVTAQAGKSSPKAGLRRPGSSAR